MNQKISEETKSDALRVAKATQKAGQSKEQTKLIAQGIEKGISEYKKQQKAKARTRDKQRKLETKKVNQAKQAQYEVSSERNAPNHWLPWALLIFSWFGFVGYIFLSKA